MNQASRYIIKESIRPMLNQIFKLSTTIKLCETTATSIVGEELETLSVNIMEALRAIEESEPEK